MATPERRRRETYLRLVEPGDQSGLPLADPVTRQEFERLTQDLLDAAIEILDLTDGDTDLEPNGDEHEDSDGGV